MKMKRKENEKSVSKRKGRMFCKRIAKSKEVKNNKRLMNIL
jgi:hypothetical protein